MKKDLLSNALLTLAIAPQTINNAAVNSASIDLSEGSSAALQVALMSSGAASVDVVIEYSDDDSTWVVDNGVTGNTLTTPDGGNVVGEVTVFPALVVANINNPQGRYARVVVTETAIIAVMASAVGVVSSLHYVDPEA